jgi:putative RecB family exonuclease
LPVFSHSRILSYETCPLRYKYAYIDQILPEEQTAEIYLGARVHEALEKLHRNLEFGKLMSEKELLTFFNTEWKKNWTDLIIIVRGEFTKEDYHKMGEKYLKDYYKRYKPFKEGKVVGLEITDSLPLDNEGEYNFFIRIDRLMDIGEGLYEIHDYKTNTELPAQKNLDEDRQLAMYSIWVRQEFEDCRDVRLVWHFLAFDKEMDSYRTEEQLKELRQDVLTKVKAIEEAERFPANASKLCFWCLYKRICPVGSQIVRA